MQGGRRWARLSTGPRTPETLGYNPEYSQPWRTDPRNQDVALILNPGFRRQESLTKVENYLHGDHKTAKQGLGAFCQN
jgi:hypothetical protein